MITHHLFSSSGAQWMCEMWNWTQGVTVGEHGGWMGGAVALAMTMMTVVKSSPPVIMSAQWIPREVFVLEICSVKIGEFHARWFERTKAIVLPACSEKMVIFCVVQLSLFIAASTFNGIVIKRKFSLMTGTMWLSVLIWDKTKPIFQSRSKICG